MKYSILGNTGLKVSRFGFGCMRFPQRKAGGKNVIDRDETARMVRYAIQNGVNYFDTAHAYPGSEEALGNALKGGLRDRVLIAGKNPVDRARSRKDLEKALEEELERLNTDYLDIHLLHCLTAERWKKCLEIGAMDFLEDMKKAGRIRFGGFSFHGSLELYKEIVDAHSWDVAQIQLNYMDVNHQAGLEGLYYTAQRNIPVIVMEPLKGGGLTDKLPDAVLEAFDGSPVKRSAAEWAFRWLIDKPEIPLVLSGVSTMGQLEENIRIFSATNAGCMSAGDREILERARQGFGDGRRVECTHCGYCMPCPHGVDIPEVFQFYNDSGLNSYGSHGRLIYQMLSKEDSRGADQCTECGTCEPLCPQSIPIIEKLKEAHTVLTSA